MDLGKLEKVDLGDIWKHEAHDFTKWLVKEENIKTLSDEIGIDIKVIETEKNVGKYRVDIYAKELESDKTVIVENQLESTDHDHLGKVLVYSSGFDADISIWITKDVSDEHRKAVEWLNEHTDEKINIFLIKIEAYKINDSKPAPKFQVICGPNNWAKVIRQSSKEDLTSGKIEQLKFWEGFNNYCKTRKTSFSIRKALPQHWYSLAMGSSEYWISLIYNIQRKTISCKFETLNHELYKKIESFSSRINDEIPGLIWDYKEDRKQNYISLIDEQQDDNMNYEWLASKAELIKKVFKNYL